MYKIKVLVCYISIWRSIPAIMFLLLSKQREIIKKDIDRWSMDFNADKKPGLVFMLCWVLLFYPEFRNLFYYRLRKSNHLLSRLIEIFYKPVNTLFISTPEIGEGLFIQHGFATIINAKKIGKNCIINQQVTIGYKGYDSPTIGDNVHITAGAIVVGDVTIGDNSIIGANSVVVKNVPPNCIVVGNPAYIVKRDGRKVKESL